MGGLEREGVMPKETVYGTWRPVSIDTPPEKHEMAAAPFRVDVAWGRDAVVQLSTLTNDGYGIKTIDPESPDGLWVTLERDGLNRLIRTLRRARDQAYGVDE